MTSWPPGGYREPRIWTKSEPAVGVIIVVLTLLVFPFVQPDLVYLAAFVQSAVSQLWIALGLTDSLLGMLGVSSFGFAVFLLALYALFKLVVVPIHERIHFEIDQRFGLNPEYTRQEFLFMENPAVVPVTTKITILENTVSALGPLVVIGVVAGSVMVIAEGVIAGLAAFVVLGNTVSSAGDVYNVARFVRMPQGTLFANFKTGDGEYQTEYAFPQQK